MTKYEQGVKEGIDGLFDRQSTDREYLLGVRQGLLIYADFISSTVDHHPVPPQPRRGDPLVRFIRLESLEATSRSHILYGLPDLSDLEGTTRREDRHPLH